VESYPYPVKEGQRYINLNSGSSTELAVVTEEFITMICYHIRLRHCC